MTAMNWKIPAHMFTSFKELLGALETFISITQFKIATPANIGEADKAAAILASAKSAEKTLKYYLFLLGHAAKKGRLSPQDVIKAFNGLSQAWYALPGSAKYDFMSPHGLDTYETSVIQLLESPAALQVARKELHYSLTGLVEEEIE